MIDATDASAVHRALQDALGSDGPAVLPRQPDAPGAVPETVPHSVALVVETSGSTGVPKRVALSTEALMASAAASAQAIGGAEPGAARWLLALPAHYIAGANVLVRSIAAGTQPVMLPPGHFDPVAFCAAAEALGDHRWYASLVPVQLARLLDAAQAEARDGSGSRMLGTLRRFDTLLIGGQALRPELRERALDAGLRIVRTYGSSETGGGCVYDGMPIGSATGAVRAREVLVDGTARIELGGAVLAEGYLAADGTLDRDRTDAAFHVEGDGRWYRTGDLGSVDAAGRVRVTGRADNVVISGGEKVSLDAVEAEVRRHGGFAEAVVVAAPSAEWGSVPVVVVAGHPSLVLAELRAIVQARLGHAAAPARIVEVPTIPLLASGKPDRVALSALVAGADGRPHDPR